MSAGELFAFAFMMMAFPFVIGAVCAFIDYLCEKGVRK